MRKIVIKVLLVFYMLTVLINVKAIDIYSNNAILYNLNDDEVIFEKNSNDQVKVASLTKIMTAIVALENIDNIKDTVVMPQEAFRDLDGYAMSGIKANETVTYEDLLYGIMLPSGADCANAIAILTFGSVDYFVQKMNEKAQQLNLVNTHFSNPIGKDEDNFSTVKDMAIILKYALNNSDFYKLFTAREYTTTTNLELKSTLVSKGKNLNVENILGSKTGFTDDAGNCLATISKINNVNYLLVTTNASTAMSYHIMDAINIYDYYSTNYSYKKILSFNQFLTTIKIKSFFEKEYNIYSENDVYMYLNNDIDLNKLTYEYNGEVTVENKEKGERIGEVCIKYEDKILYTYEIILDKKIENYDYIFVVIPIIILILLYMIISKVIKSNLQK